MEVKERVKQRRREREIERVKQRKRERKIERVKQRKREREIWRVKQRRRGSERKKVKWNGKRTTSHITRGDNNVTSEGRVWRDKLAFSGKKEKKI